ncbi:DUF3106 domain-containing protein [Massilia sp. 9096]|uniref:DUF3106 domain-containing protein n=1 Tax=Massilia sp. 9096 TaxID=1500894 RepID=UPI00068BE2D7|nr:DUF3106 domain-containing protein [Massilia sp. 9096]
MTVHKRNVAGAAAIAAAGVMLALAGLLSGCDRQESGAAPGKPASAGAVQAGAAPANAAQAGKPGAPARKGDKGGDKPLWRALTPAQQLALQPLQGEWDQMDGVRKQKWLQLANRFANMTPEEQERVHARMREWARLTPEQRELARETYNRTRKIAPDQKTATWESYQQLPDDQKKKLAASATGRKAPAVVPSQADGKITAPLGRGATSCPAGTVRNTMSATPPCVAPGALQSTTPAITPQPAPAVPPSAAPPAQPAPAPEKRVPENWGITPNNA